MTERPPARPELRADAIVALGEALDALRAEVGASLGESDARYFRRVVRVQRASEAAGRTLLALGVGPTSFGLGVTALAVGKILENMEVGHNVMHGQWDWLNDPAFSSETYDWDAANAAVDWRRSHNLRHHQWTNVLGLDDDLGYGVFRVCAEQEWRPSHAAQLGWNGLLALTFEWGIGMQEVGVAEWSRGGSSAAEVRSRAGPFLRKAARQLFKDYVLFPLLTPWNAPRVAAGNLVANVTRNVWAHTIIFCGHFTSDIHIFTAEEVCAETRGEWYLRQILASSNIEGGRVFDVLSGHLSYQIEHHLFPDLPSCRYPQIAARVRQICAAHGVPYNTGSLAAQYGSVLRRLWRYSRP